MTLQVVHKLGPFQVILVVIDHVFGVVWVLDRGYIDLKRHALKVFPLLHVDIESQIIALNLESFELI